jgi:hypothetical protein
MATWRTSWYSPASPRGRPCAGSSSCTATTSPSAVVQTSASTAGSRSRPRAWAVMDVDGSLKEPKRARHRRDVELDEDTLPMLQELLH